MSCLVKEEVLEDYKQTEVGMIPVDWNLKSFDKIAKPKTDRINPKIKGGGDFCIELEHIGQGTGSILGSTVTTENSSIKSVFEAGDVLFGKLRSYLRKYWLADTPGTCSTEIWALSSKSDMVIPAFLFQVVQTDRFINCSSEAYGTHMPRSDWKVVREYLVPLPTIEEQTVIANALSDVDVLITSLKKLIDKKRAIKTAVMQQLLTGKKRLPPFDKTHTGYKQTELGEIPEDWEVVELGKYSDITKLAGFEYSNYFNSYKDGGKVIVLRGTNITHNTLDLGDVKYIPESTSKKLPRSKLFKGDLVFAYVGTIGPIYLVEEDDRFHLGPNTAKITCKLKINKQYLLAYFKSPLIRSEIEEKISVGAQPSLSMTKIRSFKIISPGNDEQKAIANVLANMDKEIESLAKRLSKTQQLKHGMMQELLTGRTRLI